MVQVGVTGALVTLCLYTDELGVVQAQHLVSFSFLVLKQSDAWQEEEELKKIFKSGKLETFRGYSCSVLSLHCRWFGSNVSVAAQEDNWSLSGNKVMFWFLHSLWSCCLSQSSERLFIDMGGIIPHLQNPRIC